MQLSPFGLFGRKKETTNQQEQASEGQESGVLGKLRAGLRKTRDKVTGGLRPILSLGRRLDEEIIEQIEEQLYVADVGPRAVMRLCEDLREAYKRSEIKDTDQVVHFLEEKIKEDLHEWDSALRLPPQGPGVIVVAGVNGSGKTTSVGKLAHEFVREGKRVLLAASDTFRAAAVQQLEIWAKRTGSDIVKNESADPAAVAFDAVEKAVAKDYDVLIIDTAGRLHTRRNLMKELQKICRVVAKKIPGAPHETLMVLDAGTGQNGISQAMRFSEAINVSGIFLAKLDGTAKGGIIVGMRDQIDIPVKFVGIGQEAEDIAPFDADRFVEALFE